MRLFRTKAGPVVENEGKLYAIDREWTTLVNDAALYETLSQLCETIDADDTLQNATDNPHAPITDQEVWAAGVTYFRSKSARMEEAEAAGGGDFYDRVYDAERPEIFFKASASRVVGTGRAMHLRRDSKWIVPEPELTLVVTRTAEIVGYTIGNDLSCRDIEGENPLYLPQAKTFDRCAAIGPAILVSPSPPSPVTEIRLSIERDGDVVFADSTTLEQMKRSLAELVGFLFRDNSHPDGCLLMTGTGIVPPDDFSLEPNDVVSITIDEIGTLVNTME
ncbi:MAG: fumarylacetoacetate hydrolase family protein [Pirellulales bacterium]|nr:fumarylacetoacetate hydrolase family protein [Pirellulales bacterium]